MVLVESVIAYDAAINAETDALEVMPPCSLTTRSGYGKPKITHFMAFASTDDVARVYCKPSGYNDQNGFDAPLVVIYGAAAGFDLAMAKLPKPVEVPENCQLDIYAQSETAANSVVVAWLLLEYPDVGDFVDPLVGMPDGAALVKRYWEHGAALVSVTPANSTNITDLQAGRKYAIAGVGKAGVNGETAGIVGPAFIGFRNAEFGGSEFLIPLVNNGGYQVGGGPSFVDFARCGIKSPIIRGGTPFLTKCVGYTAEQPQAVIQFYVDKAFA